MHKTTLQFRSLTELALFLESAGLSNFEINYNHLTISSDVGQGIIDKATHHFHATLLEQEVVG